MPAQPLSTGMVQGVFVTPTPTPTPIAPATASPRAHHSIPAKAVPTLIVPAVAFANQPLYAEPDTPAAQQVHEWQASRPADANRMAKLAAQPQTKWLGDWNPDPYAEANAYLSAAEKSHAWPVLTLYNLPGRDCGSYSAGGAANDTAYQAWIRRVAQAMGQRPVIIVLEPDAVPELDCFSPSRQPAVLSLLRNAVAVLKQDRQAYVYLDAGNTTWQSAATMAGRLTQAGLVQADGFALNVSNFIPTAENLRYGGQLSGLVGGKHFVIDTSRNGRGSNGQWCNPVGRALGQAPSTATGQPLADAYLWIKSPGESDGECGRNEPAAGEWWPDYALSLAVNAGY
jgi:endoglucanase